MNGSDESPETTSLPQDVREDASRKSVSVDGKKRKGKIGTGGYMGTVEEIKRDNRLLHREIRELLARIPKESGDLSSFVDQELSVKEAEKNGHPDRDEIARTWESGKKTFEELIAEYERLRAQKIWSQEDLEGILGNLEGLVHRIESAAEQYRQMTESLTEHFSETVPNGSSQLVSSDDGFHTELSGIRTLVEESREHLSRLIESVRNRTGASESGVAGNLSLILQKLSGIEARIQEPSSGEVAPGRGPSEDEGKSGQELSGVSDAGEKSLLFSKKTADERKNRKAKLGLVALFGLFLGLLLLSRIGHHAGSPVNTHPVPMAVRPRPQSDRLPVTPHVDLSGVLSRLAAVQGGVNENNQAIAELSGKIDRALERLPKHSGPGVLSSRQRSLIREGKELEWLVKSWPAGPGRKEFLKMMGQFTMKEGNR
uniref:Uncharacterized protein n=1 Tax=Leptospirillum sp. Group II '5-way CG' TaxID=419541 RepID=B6ARA5_9BACT|nr:MAG: Hypothetical protein CGL2_08581002 [Leptospirillum sp. Group II '5-way CG']